jgi:hypothetical protein
VDCHSAGDRHRATVINSLIVKLEGDVDLRTACTRRSDACRRSSVGYSGDLHGQSGGTIGAGSAEDYFRDARELAFIDIVCHQGNDFEITDAFWQNLNRLNAGQVRLRSGL